MDDPEKSSIYDPQRDGCPDFDEMMSEGEYLPPQGLAPQSTPHFAAQDGIQPVNYVPANQPVKAVVGGQPDIVPPRLPYVIQPLPELGIVLIRAHNPEDMKAILEVIRLIGEQAKKHEVPWEDLFPTFDELGQHIDPVSDWSPKAEEPALQNELRAVLSKAIDDLPEDYRTAFLMHDVEGLSNPEIAESLGISLPAVKSRVHRSRLFLRQHLSRYLSAA